MRVRNPKRLTRYNDRCGCEHENHFNERYSPVLGKMVGKPRTKHRHMRVKADGGWALYIGHVCKDCEETCMQGWMVPEHVCGEGDCHR